MISRADFTVHASLASAGNDVEIVGHGGGTSIGETRIPPIICVICGNVKGLGRRKLKDPRGVGKHSYIVALTIPHILDERLDFECFQRRWGKRLINIHLSGCNVERRRGKDVIKACTAIAMLRYRPLISTSFSTDADEPTLKYLKRVS